MRLLSQVEDPGWRQSQYIGENLREVAICVRANVWIGAVARRHTLAQLHRFFNELGFWVFNATDYRGSMSRALSTAGSGKFLPRNGGADFDKDFPR